MGMSKYCGQFILSTLTGYNQEIWKAQRSNNQEPTRGDHYILLGLCSEEPDVASDGTVTTHELTNNSATGYAPVALGDFIREDWRKTSFDANDTYNASTSITKIKNTTRDIMFPVSLSSWGTVSHFVVGVATSYSEDTTTNVGTPLYWGPIVDSNGDPTTLSIPADRIAVFKKGNFSISI